MKNSALKAFMWIMFIAIIIACFPAILEAIGIALAVACQMVFIGIFTYVIIMLGYGFCDTVVDLSQKGATDEPSWRF